MPTAEARIPTERASRYLTQLCKHASHLGGGGGHQAGVTAEWSETAGLISFEGGTCTAQATQDALVLRAEAGDEETLRRVQERVTASLARFSRREPLTVNWDRPLAAAPRRHGRFVLPAVVAVLAVALHVAVITGLVPIPSWTGWAADAVVIAVLVKAVALTGHLTLGRRLLRRLRRREALRK